MLILLPPSEGKWTPSRGRPLDLTRLSYSTLNPTRKLVLDSLVELCRGEPERARLTLGLTLGQREEVVRDARLPTAPTAPVGRIYTGVLYDALALAGLSPGARRRAATRVAVTSALFGLVRLGDRIPSYRLSGSTTLPGLGPLSVVWRASLGGVLAAQAERGLVVDLRSQTYVGFSRPPPGAHKVVTVRVLQETAGVRTVVSHLNKATKGRLVASLLEDGANPGSVRGLTAALVRLGWHAERHPDDERGIDIVVAEIG